MHKKKEDRGQKKTERGKKKEEKGKKMRKGEVQLAKHNCRSYRKYVKNQANKVLSEINCYI
jgi:hypothetical protein